VVPSLFHSSTPLTPLKPSPAVGFGGHGFGSSQSARCADCSSSLLASVRFLATSLVIASFLFLGVLAVSFFLFSYFQCSCRSDGCRTDRTVASRRESHPVSERRTFGAVFVTHRCPVWFIPSPRNLLEFAPSVASNFGIGPQPRNMRRILTSRASQCGGTSHRQYRTEPVK